MKWDCRSQLNNDDHKNPYFDLLDTDDISIKINQELIGKKLLIEPCEYKTGFWKRYNISCYFDENMTWGYIENILFTIDNFNPFTDDYVGEDDCYLATIIYVKE